MYYAQPWNFPGFEMLDNNDVAQVKIDVGTAGAADQAYELNLGSTPPGEDGVWHIADLDVTQPLKVVVRENPTTGYTW